MVELVFLEDAYRKTLITEVAGVRGSGVVLGKALYYAPSKAYGHPQPTDRGHLQVGGHKLKIARVARHDDGAYAHVVTGPPPKRGERVLAHLDWDRRHLAMRAHAAMHLLEHAVLAERRGAFARPPEVLNGGQLKATLARATPKDVAAVLARVNDLVRERLPVATRWVPREEAARRATPGHVPVADVAPGEPVVRLVECGDRVRLPCDAPAIRNTGDVGRVTAPDVLVRAGGARVLLRVEEAA